MDTISEPATETDRAAPTRARLVLRLYVADLAPNSTRAHANLLALLDRAGTADYDLEVVDCFREPQRALGDGVLVTPTLAKIWPAPSETVIGTLSDARQVALTLGLVAAPQDAVLEMTDVDRIGAVDSAPASPRPPPDYRAQIERLVRHLGEAEVALQALAAGEIDAVIDPATAVPILLSQAQEAIARSEARFRDLVTRAPTIVCELTTAGAITFVNDAVRTILGHDPDTLVGQNLWETLVPPSHRVLAEELTRELCRQNVTGYEIPLTDADGGARWVAWNSANRLDADGGVLAFVLFGIDVTARREAEESARRLAEAQIARARAEAANRTKMEFLAVMSHELRTPLNAIAGYVQLLEMGLKGPVTPEQVADLERIRQSQAHLLGLINDIMNFARLETGRVTFRFRDVVVHDLLAMIETVTEPQTRAKGLDYQVGSCDSGLSVWADAEKTRQILINLVSNAIKFTGAGGRIAIECEVSGDDVTIHVRDTGQGIPHEKLADIFEPFVQVNPSFSRAHQGVGLGLAISRELALAMHGDLTVDSAVGRGSTFSLRLPRRAPYAA
jgi:PAS domain S-box-containing protein